jgi:hypothetical protein
MLPVIKLFHKERYFKEEIFPISLGIDDVNKLA